MQKYTLASNKLNSVEFSGSKSVIQRLLTILSYTKTSIEIKNYSRSEDVVTFENALKKMGFIFILKNSDVSISYTQENLKHIDLFINNSATAYRFLLTRLANYPYLKTDIELSNQLSVRPVDELYDAIRFMKGDVVCTGRHICIQGTELSGGTIELNPKISSQYVSSILLSSPYFSDKTKIILGDKQVSKSYIALTIELMRKYGINITEKNSMIYIENNQRYILPKSITIPGDMSSACYFAAIGALCKSGVTLINFDSSQADSKFLLLLKKMGAYIEFSDNSVLIQQNELNGIDADMSSMPDQVMTLAILALFAQSPTRITGFGHLKFKESDRIKTLSKNFNKMNIKYTLGVDELVVFPLNDPPGQVVIDTFNDHRAVMAFSILKLFFPYIELSETESVKKSCPEFFDNLGKLDLHLSRY